MLKRKTWAAVAFLAATGLLLAAGRPGVVKTKDGTSYDGTIEERDTDVIVTVHGIDTVVKRDDISGITYGDFAERWNADYAKLGTKDVDGRITAARKAFDQRQYDLAEKALRDALAIEPNNPQATDLLRATISQQRMSRGTASGTESPPAPVTPSGTGAVQTAAPYVTLTPEQINRVKQLELTDKDTQVRVNFGNNVRKKFYDASPTLSQKYRAYNDFARETPLVQALTILQDGTPDLTKDVKITNDPETVVAFRRDANSLILQGCATSACHGGNNASSAKFALIMPGTDPASVYTNFYVLQTSEVGAPAAATPTAGAGNTAAPTVGYMFDHARPDMSLVLQYGLAETSAQFKHPRVRGYNGIYPRGRDDPKYKAMLSYLQSMSSVQPNYALDFKLHRKGATTQP